MGTAVSYLPHAKTDEVVSKTKTVDRSTKHPFPVKFDLNTFSVPLLLIKLLVIVYDVISTPFYALYMRPWAKRAANRAIRARQEDPNDPYSPYVSVLKVDPKVAEHYIYKAETIPQFQKLALESNDRKQPALGKRQLFSVSEVLTRTGKKLTKLNLDDHYTWLSLEEVDETVGLLANGLLTQGVKYQEKVLIFAETRMEWFLCALACFRIGAIVTTLYATLGLEGIVHSFQDTEVEHVVTTEDLLPSLLKVIDRIPKVRHITVIQLHHALLLKQGKVGQVDFDSATQSTGRTVTLTTYDQLLELGKQSPSVEYTSPKADDVAVILYTSGSTGNPKGVIQTHGNFIAEFQSLYSMVNSPLVESPNSHTFYAFLPLAHTLELVCELFFFGVGVRLAYGHPTTMTDDGTSITAGQMGDLRIARPTFIAGVPLILDRIRKSLATKLESRSIFWTQLFKYACAYKNFWLGLGYDTPIVNRLVCRRAQAQLGGRVEYMLCGGAPLSADTQKIMKAFLNIKIMIGYGSTETCGAVMMTDLNDNSVGRVGGPMAGQKVRLIDWPEGGYSVHDKPRPRGEIVIGSASITQGYYRLPEQTAETYEVTEDGTRWVKMGDIGEVYPNGTFKIIDRRKDLVKMQYGEYVSLGKVEAELKNFKYAENVCVYGDSMKMYTVVFISPSIAALRKLAVSLGKPTDLPLETLCADEDIVAAVTKELLQFGVEAGLNKMEIPQRVKLCSEEWSVKSKFLTASLKINRQNIRSFYQADIERMYKQ